MEETALFAPGLAQDAVERFQSEAAAEFADASAERAGNVQVG